MGARYEAEGSMYFEMLPIAGAAYKSWSGEVIDDRGDGIHELSSWGRTGYGTLAVVEAGFIASPWIGKAIAARSGSGAAEVIPKTLAQEVGPVVNSTLYSAGAGGAAKRGALVKYEPWPNAPNSPHVDGFLFGVRQVETMQQGQILSRLGETSGRYVSPPGTSLSARGLPDGYQGSESLWQVAKPFQTESGLSAPWQGSSGMGIQHRLPQSIDDLLKSGYLTPVR